MVNRKLTAVVGALALWAVLQVSGAADGGPAVMITLQTGMAATVRCQDGQAAEAHAAAEGDALVHCHPIEGAPSATPPPTAFVTAPAQPSATPHDHGGGGPTATALPAGAKLPQMVDWGAWDPNRIPISLEAWWTQASLTPGEATSATADFGHVHAEARLPIGRDVSGTLSFDVRAVLHHNPGRLVQIRIDDDKGVVMRIPVNQTCPGGGTCAFNVPVALDTTKMSNGWREIRIRAEVQTPDGKLFLNSGGIPLRVANGGGGSDYNRWCSNRSLIARGWYDGFGYTNSVIECVPTAPVSGIWRQRFYSQEGGGGRAIVAIDRSHPIPAAGSFPAIPSMTGLTLFDAQSIPKWHELAIDTNRLADGWHALSFITINPDSGTSSCSLPGLCQGGQNHPAGIVRLWFFVANGG